MKKTSIVICIVLLIFSIVLCCFHQYTTSMLASHLAILLMIFAYVEDIHAEVQRIKTILWIQSLAQILETSKSFINVGEEAVKAAESAKRMKDILDSLKEKYPIGGKVK